MYVHIGDDILVRAIDIIFILDKQTIVSSEITKGFLENHQSASINAENNAYKSIVVTKDTIYFSPIASNTLKKRSYKLMV
ncbi:extracellular matrix regulator RemB [Niallia nealsonii]|uniref:DUF370 domain-containing protein n=1 Tax=Niallia nealsonii TaxID=115979 RepID=A0A2N0Z470_9BACI|nr:extracellular matrix/biofilm biosynthesis regulator RemA family protein [Niallia nealsonii]PKG24321.1 DUF370 domain-containing protein [Niallia nealsonii]